jgi:flavin reductase (DIM6/NTAB) family NADH-FMN oxidoreductase RutF
MTLRTNGERGDQCSFIDDPRGKFAADGDGASPAKALAFCIIDVEQSTPLATPHWSTRKLYMDYDPRSEPHNLAHDPTTCLVVPRPIGWITTISPAGVVNLAPYSFFNLVSSNPPFVMFASNARKHTQNNAESGGEFVFNLATYDLRTEMNVTGGDYPESVSEPEVANLAMAPSRSVKPPRVARSPIALECLYIQTVRIGSKSGKPGSYEMVIGEVVNVHIDDAVIVDGNIDMSRIRPIARLGYRGDYTAVDSIFFMPRV